MGLGILLGMGGWIIRVLICSHYIVVVVVGYPLRKPVTAECTHIS